MSFVQRSPTVPTELISMIFAEALPRDLRLVRAASRAFNVLATPGAFRQVHFTNTRPSLVRLRSLLRVPYIRGHIKEIIYTDLLEIERVDRPEPEGEIECDTDMRRRLYRAFVDAPLPALRAFILTFPSTRERNHHDQWYPGNELQWQWDMLDVVSDLAPLHTLTINNLPTISHRLYGRPAFQALLRSVRILRVTTLRNHDVSSWRSFWSISLQQHFLRPLSAANTLTSLTLHYYNYVDFDMRGAMFSWREMFIPQLSVLSLRYMPFDAHLQGRSHLEDCIVRHGKTLRTLELLHCTIMTHETDEDEYAAPGVRGRRWVDVWRRFEANLTKLTELRAIGIERKAYVNEDGQGLRFERWTSAIWYTRASHHGEHLRMSFNRREDTEALQSLKDLIDSRARGLDL
ncbi:hypothetical protein FA95DRAFT_1596235 [Auriscalpium vulgare]|uniref:Uncharacterized protein n=1 Tax=Auriscalpium vulgare TaxID=40419 RepID=A0ACB8RQF8_9AGAM|nr:hypothetical protein FA95DRAFT_1596235 [Auriscalpium vulgare]